MKLKYSALADFTLTWVPRQDSQDQNNNTTYIKRNSPAPNPCNQNKNLNKQHDHNQQHELPLSVLWAQGPNLNHWQTYLFYVTFNVPETQSEREICTQHPRQQTARLHQSYPFAGYLRYPCPYATFRTPSSSGRSPSRLTSYVVWNSPRQDSTQWKCSYFSVLLAKSTLTRPGSIGGDQAEVPKLSTESGHGTSPFWN